MVEKALAITIQCTEGILAIVGSRVKKQEAC